MTNNTTTSTTTSPVATNITTAVDRYIAVWTIADLAQRADAVAALWSDHAIEYIEGKQFIGHAALTDRVTEAYEAFIAPDTYTATGGDDVKTHGDMLTFTIRLDHAHGEDAGETAWSARVFLRLAPDGRIREDYQLTVKALAG